jgi:hypothetical protein
MRLSLKPHTLPWLGPRSRKSGSFALFAKGGISDGRYRDSWYPTLRKKREGWGTRGFVTLSAEDKKCPFHIPRVGNAGGRLKRNKVSIKPRLLFGTAGSTRQRTHNPIWAH